MTAIFYYLLKVIICSGLLFAYYHLALRNKLFHHWNRFYLLSAVALSILLPVLQITIWQTAQAQNGPIQFIRVVQSADNYLEEFTLTNHNVLSTEALLWAAYLVVSTALAALLMRSVYQVWRIIKSHPVQWLQNVRFVNTCEPGTPFSFFTYIFWNEKISLQSATGQKIFQHELVHVRERHTADKLAMQVVLIFFWCNPFFWLMRRELKAIHEFIADKKAIGDEGTAAFAAMVLQSAYPLHYNTLVNPFFQTAIKRRIAMLTKIAHPKRAYVSRIIALPLIAVVGFAFTVRTKTIVPVAALDKEITVVIDAGHGRMENGLHNGSQSEGFYEDDITLELAKAVQAANTNPKLHIVLSRTDENMVGLKERVALTEKAHADLFISLHLDAVPVSALANESIHQDGMEIYVSNRNTPYQQNSEVLGATLQQHLGGIYKTYPSLIKRQVGVWVLDQNSCPAVLIECGFITNDKDRAFITNPKNQQAVAAQILASIQQYAAENRTGATLQAVADTLPKTPVNIASVDVNSVKKELTITYKDGRSETLTEAQAQKRGLIDNHGFANEKRGAKVQPMTDEKMKVEGTFKGPQPNFYQDGKELLLIEVNKINPSDIESMNVLKDKAATDKYGSKGINGVVEIIMKKGKSSAPLTIHSNGEQVMLGRVSELQIDSSRKIRFAADDVVVTGHKRERDTKEVVVHGYKTASDHSFSKSETEASIDKAVWRKFLEEHLISVVTAAAGKGATPGSRTINLRFIVNTDGTVSDVEALNDPGFGIAAALVSIMKESPRWNPAQQNGQAVRSFHDQPVTIMIQNQ